MVEGLSCSIAYKILRGFSYGCENGDCERMEKAG